MFIYRFSAIQTEILAGVCVCVCVNIERPILKFI